MHGVAFDVTITPLSGYCYAFLKIGNCSIFILAHLRILDAYNPFTSVKEVPIVFFCIESFTALRLLMPPNQGLHTPPFRCCFSCLEGFNR